MPPTQTYVPEQELTRYNDTCKVESEVAFSAREATEDARKILGVYSSVLNNSLDGKRCFIVFLNEASEDTITGRLVLGKSDVLPEQQRGFRAFVNEDGSATFTV